MTTDSADAASVIGGGWQTLVGSEQARSGPVPGHLRQNLNLKLQQFMYQTNKISYSYLLRKFWRFWSS